jgi:hypothetical protein
MKGFHIDPEEMSVNIPFNYDNRMLMSHAPDVSCLFTEPLNSRTKIHSHFLYSACNTFVQYTRSFHHSTVPSNFLIFYSS